MVARKITYDMVLLGAVLALVAVGLVMVTSASMAISERQFATPFHYLFRQSTYLVLGFVLSLFVIRIPADFWTRVGPKLLLGSIGLLVVVLIPGIGRQVNGSTRWIGFGPLALQVSEFAKFAMVVYLASYLVRHAEEVRTQVSGFLKPMLLLGVVGILLLKEPDFGATAVITVTMLCMMYLSGVRLWQFAVLLGVVLLGLGILAVSSPYRLVRLTTFLNPWAHQFNSGYQLTQSLIAFGRGGVWGVGLGDSIQKLFYLPEAHTDFLFAVLAEELGLVGVIAVMALYTVLVSRVLSVARAAQRVGKDHWAYMAYGFGVWLAMQAAVNIGVNAGLFPTKGLTLPFISYGGSSILVMSIVIAIVLRIDHEVRHTSKASDTVRSLKRDRARFGF